MPDVSRAEEWTICGHWAAQKRDSQRQRVYNAENRAQKAFGFRRHESLGEIEAFIRTVLADDWFRRQFYWCTSDRIVIGDGRGRRRAACCKRGSRWILKYPRWARTELIILHELCHVLAEPVRPAHGPYFARCLLELVRRYVGLSAYNALYVAYRNEGVRFHPDGEARKVAV